MNSILRIYVPSTLNVIAQHTEILTVTLDLTPNILKQPTPHDQVHYSLRIKCRDPNPWNMNLDT